METWYCAFWGQNKFDYEPYQDEILHEIDFLIQRGVTHFYNFYRNTFDTMCAATVDKLRENYPQIKNILVLFYKPNGDFVLPKGFDRAVYLQDSDAPTRLVVRNTYRKLVQSVDFVFSGVARGFSEERSACNYARWALKSMFNVVTGKSQFWLTLSPTQIDKAVRDFEERMRTDEEFRMLNEEIMRRCEEQAAPFLKKRAKKHKKKKTKQYKPPVWVTAETKKETEG